MAAYAQFGYGGFPSASQLLSSSAAGAQPTHVGEVPQNASASLATANAPAVSPPGGDCQTNPAGGGDVSSGALSPDALSQTSNATGPVAPHNSAPGTGGGGGGGGGGSGGSLDGTALGGGHNTPASASSCCENGRPIMTDPVSGQSVCSCQYDSARLALSSYSRLPAASVGVYGTPYPSTDQNPYQSIGVDSSAFYSPLSNPYTLKDTAAGTEMGAWTSAGLQPTTGYYSYDPMSAYGYGASYDLAARRKNATRESTATLKTWLNEHKKNPYPTKGEKIMLAIITKMTLTQVSTWFANARRRLKKENKMTWEPKNRTDDDEDAMVSDDEKDKDDGEPNKSAQSGSGIGKDLSKEDEDLNDEDEKALSQPSDLRASFCYPGGGVYHGGVGGGHLAGYHPYHPQHPAYYQHQQAVLAASYHAGDNSMNANGGGSSSSVKNETNDPKNQLSRDCGVPIPATKPKIWSLADTVACKTPPPAYQLMGQAQLMPQHAMHPSSQQQQQQQQQQPVAAGVNYGMGLSLQQQQQNQQQSHPHSSQVQHTMMTSFSGTPYSRAHTTAYGGFLGATTQQLHTTTNMPYSNSSASNSNSNNNNNNSSNNIITAHNNHGSNSSSSSSSNNNNNNSNNTNTNHSTGNTNNTHVPTIPTTGNTHSQQPQPQLQAMRQSQLQLQHQLQPQHAANQRAMGFPEAQPDTPPQTPPNMKLSNVASSLPPTALQAPTIASCRNTNLNSSSTYPMNFSTRFADYSARDDSSSGSSCSSGSPQLHQNEASYHPLFKRAPVSVAGFVPPV